jgi:hypothetical protein
MIYRLQYLKPLVIVYNMSIYMSIFMAVLFFVLTPGVLVSLPGAFMTLPQENAKIITAVFHAVVFAVIYYLTIRVVRRSLYGPRKNERKP